MEWDLVSVGSSALACSSAVCDRGAQKIGFHCIEKVFMLKIKLQTAHFAFQALLSLTDIRVSVEMCIWDKNPIFPEKMRLKENF